MAKHEAGSELNALVAEKVMGWTKTIHREDTFVRDDGCLGIGHNRCEDCNNILETLHAVTCPWLKRHQIWRCSIESYSDTGDPKNYRPCQDWSPSTDPAADYEVLKVAREWRASKRRAFGDALWAIWQTRWVNAACPSTAAILYQPGDYSRAALKAVEGTPTVDLTQTT